MIRIARFILSFLIFSTAHIYAQNKVYVLNLDGAINPAASDYINYGITEAVDNNAECLILKLNTPGGLLKSTRVIVSDFLSSPIPVIVFVSPSGSQAASAGVFITIAAHIAVMAPGTNIGAAHPVTMGGQADSTMMEKATNDAAAFIRTISEKRKRNIEWAEDAVRKSLSITETEAEKINVINFVAANVQEILNKIDGKEIETAEGKIILDTKNVEIVELDKTFAQELLSIFSDPNVAYILFMLGIYGLLFELYSPGAIFPGVIGGICLILAFYSMHTLPINYAGLALIIFSIILFVLEIKIISHGILTVGGIVSLALGSIMLIDEESALEMAEISWEIILVVVVLTALFFLFAISFGIKAQRLKPTTGMEGIIGEIGEAITKIKSTGSVKIHGEIWNAQSLNDEINKGDKVVVERVENLKLIVKKFSH